MEAIGISIDGNELKIAHLEKIKSDIKVIAMEKVFIKKAGIEELPPKETEESYEDAFGMDVSHEEVVHEEVSPESDDNVIFNTLFKYSKKNLKLGLNILQSDVLFTNISAKFNPKDKNLKKKIMDEVEKTSIEITDDNFNFITKKGNEFIAFYHNNKLDLLNQILKAKSNIKGDLKILLVDINEIALINLFTNMVEVDEEKSILVYVGNEFSRILFFHGKELVNFSHLINEGYHSDELLTNLYGKTIFEIDITGFEEINNIFITGDGNISQYEEFFKEKFPKCKISRLPFENNFIIVDESKKTKIDSYAIPISLAWKILEGKERKFIDTNFLPASIRKQQRAFTIAWHGFIFIILIILLIAFTYWENKKIGNEIEKIKQEVSLLNSEIDEISPIAVSVDSMATEIAKINPKLALVDSLKPKNILYSDLLRYMSDSVKGINSIWVTELSASGKSFSLSGNSLYRSRIYKLANTYEQSRINNVSSVQVMGKNIHSFDISGEIPDNK